MSIPTPACTPGAEAEPGPNGPVPSEIVTGACPPAAVLPVRCGPEPAEGPTPWTSGRAACHRSVT